MKRTIIVALGFLCILTAVNTLAQDLKFEYKFKPGEIYKTKTTQKNKITGEVLRGRPFEVIVELFSSQRVTGVSEQGVIEMIEAQDSVYATMNGQAIEHPPVEKLNGIQYLRKKTKSGKCLEISPLKELPAELKGSLDQQQQECKNEPGFPDRALKIGESWNEEKVFSYDLGVVKIDQTISVVNRFLGFDKRDGFDCAVFRQTATVNGAMNFEEGETGTITGTGRGTKFFATSIGQDLMRFMDAEVNREIETPKGKQAVKIMINMKTELLK